MSYPYTQLVFSVTQLIVSQHTNLTCNIHENITVHNSNSNTSGTLNFYYKKYSQKQFINISGAFHDILPYISTAQHKCDWIHLRSCLWEPEGICNEYLWIIFYLFWHNPRHYIDSTFFIYSENNSWRIFKDLFFMWQPCQTFIPILCLIVSGDIFIFVYIWWFLLTLLSHFYLKRKMRQGKDRTWRLPRIN